MLFSGPLVSLALLMTFGLEVTDAIRTLKEGPMIDKCTDVSMIIFIQADLYRTGHHVSPGELFLGDARHSNSRRCQAVDTGDHEYVIEAGLQDCGTKLSISEDDVIYSNKLVFLPAFRHFGITRLTEAVIPVSCHYKRKHIVSSSAHQKPLIFSKLAKFSTGTSLFSLRLLTDDWSNETPSSTFYLGDVLHLEASYNGPDSRRIFIDSCVGTLTPDIASVPRYYFIENYG